MTMKTGLFFAYPPYPASILMRNTNTKTNCTKQMKHIIWSTILVQIIVLANTGANTFAYDNATTYKCTFARIITSIDLCYCANQR